MAICMFVVVGFITRSQSAAQLPDSELPVSELPAALTALLGSAPPLMVAVLGGMAVMVTLVGLVLAPLFARGTSYLVYGLLRWSFAEAVAIFGFVVFQLGGSWLVFGVFLAWAAALLLLAVPTARDEAQYQRQRARRS